MHGINLSGPPLNAVVGGKHRENNHDIEMTWGFKAVILLRMKAGALSRAAGRRGFGVTGEFSTTRASSLDTSWRPSIALFQDHRHRSGEIQIGPGIDAAECSYGSFPVNAINRGAGGFLKIVGKEPAGLGEGWRPRPYCCLHNNLLLVPFCPVETAIFLAG